jgi:parallel beta-helix repeat protein
MSLETEHLKNVFGQTLVPETNEQTDIGSPGRRFRNIRAKEVIVDTITNLSSIIAGGTITADVNNVVNVKAHGAIGNGVIDDTAAIQAAINTLTSGVGGVVYFPTGTYLITAPITLPVTGEMKIRLQGIGVPGGSGSGGSTLLEGVGFSGTELIKIGDGVTLVERWAIDGLTFIGVTGSTRYGIAASKTAQFQITNCFFNRCARAISLTTTSQVGLIAHNVVGSTNKVGLYLDQVTDVRIIGNDLLEGLVGHGTGSHAIHGARIGPGMVISGNKISDWEGNGIIASSFGGINTILISGNHIANCGVNGVFVSEEGATVTGNTFGGMKSGATAAIRTDSDGVNVAGNFIDCNELHIGIRIAGSHGTFTGNTIRRANAVGIDIPDGSNNIIVGNRVFDDDGTPTMTHGIRERLTANNNLIVGNHISGSTTTDVTITGAATQYGMNFEAVGPSGARTTQGQIRLGTDVRFGTRTANGDAAINGYVTITDDAGTTRKLATIA